MKKTKKKRKRGAVKLLPRQYGINVGGIGVFVTFGVAEASIVKAEAKLHDLSVEEWLKHTVEKRLSRLRRKRSHDEMQEMIVLILRDVGKPPARSRA